MSAMFWNLCEPQSTDPANLDHDTLMNEHLGAGPTLMQSRPIVRSPSAVKAHAYRGTSNWCGARTTRSSEERSTEINFGLALLKRMADDEERSQTVGGGALSRRPLGDDVVQFDEPLQGVADFNRLEEGQVRI